MKGNTSYPWRSLCSGHVITIWKVAVLASKVCAFILLLLAIRLILLVGMGVGKKELPGALLDFPPPPPIRDTGPFPLVLKFHKVGGSTVVDALWKHLQCNTANHGLQHAWRPALCGAYDTHHNLLFVRGGLPTCTRTPSYVVVALFRQPLHKLLSTLYWYPPLASRQSHPWTTPCGNWTAADVRFMLSQLSANRNPLLQPPLQEYTAVLGGATAHSKGAERKSWASLQTQSEVTLRGYTQEESVSDPIARRTAIRKLRHDPTLVVGLNEKMDDSMVLIALRLGWEPEKLVYQSQKSTKGLKPGDPRYNVNSGKYHELSTEATALARYLLRDDERVYAAAVEVHGRQTSVFPAFKDRLRRFRVAQEALIRSTGTGSNHSLPYPGEDALKIGDHMRRES